jgi:type II secretory pathway pseudopilin PulG
MNGFKINNFAGRKSPVGATLVIIILSMLVLIVIGVAIYALTSTAMLNQVAAQRAARAFYLAESGIRIVASEYHAALNTSTTVADNTLANLHNKEFILPDNVSKFALEIYPYWFRATSTNTYAANATPVILYLPGDVPPIDDTGTTPITFPANGLLRMNKLGSPSTVAVAGYSAVTDIGGFNATSGGTPVTFAFSTPFTIAIGAGDEFYIGYIHFFDPPADAEATQGGDLIMNVDDDNKAKLFPPQKGTIFVVNATAIDQYSYDSRILTTTSTPHTVRLTNMQPIAGAPSPQWPLTIISGREIYVGKSVGFRSASEYGQ